MDRSTGGGAFSLGSYYVLRAAGCGLVLSRHGLPGPVRRSGDPRVHLPVGTTVWLGTVMTIGSIAAGIVSGSFFSIPMEKMVITETGR
jgi:hypothetical protein